MVAEVAQAHDGSLGIAHSYIDALANTGVDAIKFQTHIASSESSEFEPFRIKFSYEDNSRFEYWKRMEFSGEQWAGLKKHCEDVGIEFLSSPFSIAAVDLLERIGVKRYKIGSGEVNNLLLLHRVATTGKPIIISSGMSSFEELRNSVNFLKPFMIPLSILQCTTAYPTKPEQWGLHIMRELEMKFNLPIGFSDHSGDIYACLAAATLGARILEFHAVFDKRMFGPDAQASITINQITQLVKGVREIECALTNPIMKDDESLYSDTKKIFGKALSINRNMNRGEEIKLTDLESKKPADKGIPASLFQSIIGRKVNKDIRAHTFINLSDLL